MTDSIKLAKLRTRIADELAFLSWACDASEVSTFMSKVFVNRSVDNLLSMDKEMRWLKRKKSGVAAKNDVTDEMIERARAYPIERLIQFNKQGLANAPCHDDKKPSLYFGKKTGRAFCPVCQKSFDSIGWLMSAEGMGFKEAVRLLNV